jgi:hypothetical protein
MSRRRTVVQLIDSLRASARRPVPGSTSASRSSQASATWPTCTRRVRARRSAASPAAGSPMLGRRPAASDVNASARAVASTSRGARQPRGLRRLALGARSLVLSSSRPTVVGASPGLSPATRLVLQSPPGCGRRQRRPGTERAPRGRCDGLGK